MDFSELLELFCLEKINPVRLEERRSIKSRIQQCTKELDAAAIKLEDTIKQVNAYKESPSWVKKAKILEEQGKLDEAAKLYFDIDSFELKIKSFDMFIEHYLLKFCKKHKIPDPRLIDIYNARLKYIEDTLKNKFEGLGCSSSYLSESRHAYSHRAESYDILGMPAEAQKDREAVAKLLERYKSLNT